MKKALLSLAIAALIFGRASADLKYWDTNGTTDGAGGATPSGTWSGTATNWNTDASGGAGGSISAWTSTTDDAFFSAGSDATGTFTVTVSGTQTAASVVVEEGTITQSGGTVSTGNGDFTINSGALWSIDSSARFNSAGKVVLRGGTLRQTNPTNALSFISATKGLEVNGSGTVNYTSSGTGTVSIYGGTSGTITGTGGTTSNGGAGTLIKAGPHEFRYQGVGLPNTTYAKLVVNEGLFRLGFNSSVSDERGFGAVPLAPLADAITLNNGGSIGTSFTVTLHVNRGITLGAGGGAFNTSAGSMTVPGIVSGAGNLIKNTTGTLTLSGNNTYDGNTLISSGILVAGSANALGSTVGNTQVTGTGELRTDGATATFTINEAIQIAGGGAGTAGAINVQNSSSPTFSGPITLTGNATVAVSGTSSATFTNPAAFTATTQTLTLQGGTPSTGNGGTISGTVNLGTGALVKAQGGTWRLNAPAGNTYSGGTTISSGTLLVNNTTGSGTGSGAVAVNGGTLGGTGIIDGPVTVGAGAVAPGESPGTLTINSTFVLNPASALAYELNGANQTVGGGVNDLITGITDLTLDGTLNVTETVAGSFLAAVNGDMWRLINYSGSLVDNGLALGSMPALAAGLEFTIDTSTFGQVNLSVVPEAGAIAAIGLVGLLSVGAVWFKKLRAQRAAV